MASKKKKLVKEDIRFSPQSYPDTKPGGVTSSGSERGVPSISVLDPYLGQPDLDIAKIFRDEQPAAEGGHIMPFTLDRIYDSMVKLVEGSEGAKEMLKNTLSHPSMTEAQKELIKKQIAIYANIAKLVEKNSKELDLLAIGGK